MKKTAISLMLVLVMVLAMVLVPVPVAKAEGTKHDHDDATKQHCVCGATKTESTDWTGGANGIGNHTCAATDGWQPLTDTGDTLDAGKYYLTGNIESTKRFLISSGEVTICLNGYDIKGNESQSNQGNRRCFVVSGGATLNICDCQGGGEISSKTVTSAGGSALFLTGSNSNVVNLYSGILVGSPIATAAGGTVRIEAGTCNLYNAVIKDGKNLAASNCWAGNVYVGESGGTPKDKIGTFNMYGGSIQNGTATSGGNIYVNSSSTNTAGNASFNMYGGSVVGGSIERKSQGKLNIKGGFFELGVDFADASPYIIDMRNNTYSDSLTIDLNGNGLAGTITTGSNELYIADSTAAVAGAGTGKLNATVKKNDTEAGTIAQGKALPAVAGELAGQRYVTIDGVAHRIYVGFDTIRLYKDDAGNIGMNYVTNFQMDDEVKALLTDVEMATDEFYAVGCKFGAAAPVGYSKANYKPDIATNISAILNKDGTDDTDFATAFAATTFVNLTIDGQTVPIESKLYEYSLKDVYVQLDKIEKGVITGGPLTGATKEIYDFIGTEYADVVATLNG